MNHLKTPTPLRFAAAIIIAAQCLNLKAHDSTIGTAPIKLNPYMTFELATGGNPLNPLDYSSSTSPYCMGLTQICTIQALTSSEVYTFWEAIVVKGDFSYAEKPKVDNGMLTFQADIDYALSDNSSSVITSASGREISKRP